MATYSSYKKISGASLSAGSVTDAKLETDAFKNYDVKWIRGCLGQETPGCCCLWTVPTGVTRLTFELWGAGGNGHGLCVNNRCQHYAGAQGGYYTTKTISTVAGCQYSICAGGVYGCQSVECFACHGCSTYVNGFNLSNFCALGGKGGCANGSWSTGCNSEWGRCCTAPAGSHWGGDFSMGNHAGGFSMSYNCHCYRHTECSTGAPFLTGGNYVTNELTECWMRCGCRNVPYASGGQGGMTTYCGSNCCGRGTTGGSGVVKITYF